MPVPSSHLFQEERLLTTGFRNPKVPSFESRGCSGYDQSTRVWRDKRFRQRGARSGAGMGRQPDKGCVPRWQPGNTHSSQKATSVPAFQQRLRQPQLCSMTSWSTRNGMNIWADLGVSVNNGKQECLVSVDLEVSSAVRVQTE